MNSRPSPKSQILLLRGDGSLEPIPPRAGFLHPAFIVLARELCLFERFDAAAVMSPRAAAQAARLHAESAAPYQNSAYLITNRGKSFGIWWWDAQWVGAKLGATGVEPGIRVLPEPLVRAAGEGWRIVKASSGYEAQSWEDGFLRADLWRRRPFDAAAWQAFIRVQPASAGAEEAVLIAQDVPWTVASSYRRTILSDWDSAKSGRTAIAAGLAAVLGATLYFAGETVGLNRDTRRLEAEAATLQARTPAGGAGSAQIAALRELRSAVDGPDPMVMLQVAQEAIAPFGHRIVAFDASQDAVTITLPREAVSDIDFIARELAASPYFAQVDPSLDENRERLSIELTARR